MVLVEQIHAIAFLLPVEERYGLAGQMRRAATSVPSNVAEGHARGEARDLARFFVCSARFDS
ncbi:four helix bundle protein [Dyella sp.]|uniref:four helix bundle protein n=1 Tax=Dyella sp. TaxID=1869338 RepID=UPI0039C888AE